MIVSHSYCHFCALYVVRELYEVISESLDDAQSSMPFKLYISPPVTDLDPKKNFWSQKLAPASRVYIRFTRPNDQDKKPVLKTALLQAALDQPVPSSDDSVSELAADISATTNPEQEDPQESRIVNVANPAEPAFFQSSNQAKKSDKPKWFRMQ